MIINKTHGTRPQPAGKPGHEPIADMLWKAGGLFMILLLGGIFAAPASRAAEQKNAPKPADAAPFKLLSEIVLGDSVQLQDTDSASATPTTPVQQAGARSAYSEAIKSTPPPSTVASKKAGKEAKAAKEAEPKSAASASRAPEQKNAPKPADAAPFKLLSEIVLGDSVQLQDTVSAPATPATPVQQAGARSAYAEALKSTAAPSPAGTAKPAAKAKAPPAHPAAPVSALAAADAGPRIRVSQVRFTGNSVYSQQQLAALVAPDVNRDLTFAQLTGLAARVENYYHANGYQLARAVLPKQDLRSGAPLEIQILEGRLGRVNVTGAKRYSAERVQDTVTCFIEPGKPFTIPQVERPLVLLNQRSGIIASSMLKPGSQVGYTDIDVDIKESRRITGSIEANNFGTEDVGEFGITAAAGLPNLFGLGDELGLFSTIPLDGSNSWSWQASYSVPVNVCGTIAQAYIGASKNRAENEYAILDIKGDSLSWGAGASHAFVFNARNILKVQAWFEWQDLEQKMLGFATSEDNIRKLRAGADYDRKDSTGRTFVSLYLHTGLGEMLGGMDSNSVLSSRAYARADDNFAKLALNAMRVQSFTPRLYALFSLAGQLSFSTLVSGEQIYLGGANTVRGQPASFYYGDDGYILNAEGRFSILPGTSRWQIAGFIDHGQVHVREPIVGQKDWSSLSGGGIGARAEIIKGLDARLDLGFPIGARRGDSCYVYIQARYSF